MYLNIGAMVISGVWLTTQGYIFAVWPAVLVLLFSPFVFPVLILPAAMCAGIMHLFGQAKPWLGKIMAVLSVGYLVFAFTFYSMLLFRMMAEPIGSHTNLIAGMVYGVAAGLAPWTILAVKDRDNLFFTGLVLMAEVTSIIVMVAAVLLQMNFWPSAFAFWGILTGFVMLQALYERVFLKKETVPPVSPPTSSS